MYAHTTDTMPQTASFDAVMGYLHSIPISYETKKSVYQQLRIEILDSHIQTMKDRLKQIAALKKGWDGYDGIAIKKATIDNFATFLDVCSPSDVSDWSLFPNTNGTLLLEQKNAAISISSKAFSYYAELPGKYMEAENQTYTLQSILETVRAINVFLKNDR